MSEVITKTKTVSRGKSLLLFILTNIGGFVLFIFPNLLLGISKWNGGLSGINLLFMALFQFFSVCTLIYFSLKIMGKDFRFIGLSSNYWKVDSVLGLLTGLSWTALQVLWIIPSTGGSERNDIAQILETMDGTALGLISYIALGVIGGGITEEIFNRGYFINVLKSTFKNQQFGLWIAAILSILFFAAGHLPSNTIEWFDILPPTLAYTLLFIYTRRLTASIVAHAVYNATAILSVYYLYYQ
ncbi:type II CAAX endopeptidase family protein [Catalinimonas sp. 4WD22]|uniref:CPBP family intramembrane glutamic endopeptidase n=1 Tax=Catalinimonas locisalis TaxID=3133978 RepID=UPI003100D3E0